MITDSRQMEHAPTCVVFAWIVACAAKESVNGHITVNAIKVSVEPPVLENNKISAQVG